MNNEYLTTDEVIAMAKKKGLYVIEDFMLSLANGKRSIPIESAGCMQEPPYSTLYSKNLVDKIIEML